jgi:hypothetical protein
MKKQKIIQWLEMAKKFTTSLKDAADGDENNCSAFDKLSIQATQISNGDLSDMAALKQNISIYIDIWILPNICRALEEMKREPERARAKREEEREKLGRIMDKHRKDMGKIF